MHVYVDSAITTHAYVHIVRVWKKRVQNFTSVNHKYFMSSMFHCSSSLKVWWGHFWKKSVFYWNMFPGLCSFSGKNIIFFKNLQSTKFLKKRVLCDVTSTLWRRQAAELKESCWMNGWVEREANDVNVTSLHYISMRKFRLMKFIIAPLLNDKIYFCLLHLLRKSTYY